MQHAAPLPILRLMGAALHDVFGNLTGLVRIAWPYYALAGLFALLGLYLARGDLLGDAVAAIAGGGTAQLILSLAGLACIVAWQRHVLLATPLRGVAPLNMRVLRYATWSFLLTLLCSLPIIAAGLLGFATDLIWHNPADGAPFSIGMPGIGLLALGALATLALFVRLNLVLPAISADDRATGLGRSWALTRGHGLRLFGLFLLLLLGLWLLGALAGMLDALLRAIADSSAEADGAPADVPLMLGAALDSALDLVSAMLGASLTAGVYRHLAGLPA